LAAPPPEAVHVRSSLTLYATRAGVGPPDTSPFVLKTEVQLQMAGLAYGRVSTMPRHTPTSLPTWTA
jgi:hypothetical protein